MLGIETPGAGIGGIAELIRIDAHVDILHHQGTIHVGRTDQQAIGFHTALALSLQR